MIKRLYFTLLCLFLSISPLFVQPQIILSSPDDAMSLLTGKIVTEAYKRLGIQARIETYPSERSLVIANSGESFGEVCRIRGIDRIYSNLIMISVPVNIIEGVVVSKNHSFPVTGWESLRPYSISIKKGVIFAERGTRGMNVEPVTTQEQLFLKLNSGRVDVIVITRITALSEIKNNLYQNMRILEPPLVTLKLYHYIHKDHAHLVPELTRVLQEMRDEGLIDQMRNQAIKDYSDLSS